LKEFADGEFQITGRTLDDTKWTVAYIEDDGPVRFFVYHRDREGDARMEYLFSNRDDLDQYPLVKMHSPVIKSRDGLDLVCYLTLPPGTDLDGDGVPSQAVPLVLDVHGGPWARDSWGFNSSHQWLANRGYAVLSVNYRGSTGFGKEFVNASAQQWSRKMHDDLLDAVEWAVKQGIANEDKVAIMGGSYGGYATLVGLTFTPEVFACGVDIVGPSSLVTLLENVPPYWAPFMPVMKNLLGEVETEEGRQELLEMSPLTKVDRIQRPLLIGQGANDPRVTQLEADQIVEAMQAKSIPVTYVLYPDEGHGFARPENNMSFNAVTEAFLATHLGGRYEPIGDDFQGASIHVPAGADGVPGLREALKAEQLTMPEESQKPE
jgi:dipeptidyl aminopeptidase/acylaminoacyl peptidase